VRRRPRRSGNHFHDSTRAAEKARDEIQDPYITRGGAPVGDNPAPEAPSFLEGAYEDQQDAQQEIEDAIDKNHTKDTYVFWCECRCEGHGTCED